MSAMTVNSPPAPGDQAGQRRVTFEAAEFGQALTTGARLLGVAPDEVGLRVVSRRRRGLFGLGGEVLVVEATWPAAGVDNAGAAAAPAAAETPAADAAATAVPDAQPAGADARSKDGRFELHWERARASVAVHKPAYGGQPVSLDTIHEALLPLPLSARDEAAIDAALQTGDGVPRLFGAIAPSMPAAEGSPAAIKIAADESMAWLIPWEPVDVEAPALRAMLADAGVVAGLDEALLDSLHGQRLAQPAVIARGVLTQHGQDGRVELVAESRLVDANRTAKKNGRVDLTLLKDATSVQAGEVLMTRVSAVLPRDGISVRGTVSPAQPANVPDLGASAGSGTAVSEDGNVLSAAISGTLVREGGRLTVQPVYVVTGDFAPPLEPLEYVGDAVVTGSVLAGATLRVSGHLLVCGDIRGAEVEVGETLTVLGAINSGGKGKVRVNGELACPSIVDAAVWAGGAIRAGNDIRGSTAISQDQVIVDGAGLIVGGTVRGLHGVQAHVAGSAAGAPTLVQAGWGEEIGFDTAEGAPPPQVVIDVEVHKGAVITVRGGVQRVTQRDPGGVWTLDPLGQLRFSPATARVAGGARGRPAAPAGRRH